MPKHINSAYRVHAILCAACEQVGHEQTWQAFANVFGVENPNGRKAIFEVHRMIDLLYDQIETAKTQMKQSNFSEDLYEPYFRVIEERITPGLMFNSWRDYKDAIGGTLPTLKFCSEVLLMKKGQLTKMTWTQSRTVFENSKHYWQKAICHRKAKSS